MKFGISSHTRKIWGFLFCRFFFLQTGSQDAPSFFLMKTDGEKRKNYLYDFPLERNVLFYLPQERKRVCQAVIQSLKYRAVRRNDVVRPGN
jgi:hypothetical protein